MNKLKEGVQTAQYSLAAPQTISERLEHGTTPHCPGFVYTLISRAHIFQLHRLSAQSIQHVLYSAQKHCDSF